MIFLTLTLGSRNYFLPERPHSRWLLGALKDHEDTLRCALETMCHRFCSSLPSIIPLDNYLHLSFILSSPVALVITRCPVILFDIPRILTLTALQFLAAWIPLRIITRACRVSAHPQLFMCFTKVFKIIFDLPKILWSLWLLKFLLACIMVNPISLVVLMTSLVIIILSLLTQYSANTRNHHRSL